MTFKGLTRKHSADEQRDTPEPADSRPPRHLFHAHPLLWLAVAGHGYPVGSRLSRLGRQPVGG